MTRYYQTPGRNLAGQLETRLPIWDYSTMIRWIHSGVVQTPYSGYLGDFSTTPTATAGANGHAAHVPGVCA